MLSDAAQAALHDIEFNIDLALRYLKSRHPAIAWQGMAAAGNVHRHDYEDIIARQVWDTVKLALPALRAVVETESE